MSTVGSVCVVLLAACASTAGAQELEGLAAEALAAEKATWQSEVDGDVGGVARRIAEDFVSVNTDADSGLSVAVGRQATVASIERTLETMTFGDFEFLTPHARVLGSTVILTFRWRQTYLPRSGGKPIRLEGVSTSVWVKDSPRGWQNVHFHAHTRPSNGD